MVRRRYKVVGKNKRKGMCEPSAIDGDGANPAFTLTCKPSSPWPAFTISFACLITERFDPEQQRSKKKTVSLCWSPTGTTLVTTKANTRSDSRTVVPDLFACYFFAHKECISLYKDR